MGLAGLELWLALFQLRPARSSMVLVYGKEKRKEIVVSFLKSLSHYEACGHGVKSNGGGILGTWVRG